MARSPKLLMSAEIKSMSYDIKFKKHDKRQKNSLC